VKARNSSGVAVGRTSVTARVVASSSEIVVHVPLARPKLTIRPPRPSRVNAVRPMSPPTPSNTTSTGSPTRSDQSASV
jgi:hypothetical protein